MGVALRAKLSAMPPLLPSRVSRCQRCAPATLAFPQVLRSDDCLDAIQAELVKRHGERASRLQE